MDHKVPEPRGVPLGQQRLWAYTIQKEDKLRLKWFKKNESRLDEIANKVFLRQVPEEVRDEMKQRTMNCLKNVEQKHTVVKEEEPPIVEDSALTNIMRPVPKEVKDLLYSSRWSRVL